jgi:hypothetical protein
LSCGDERIRIKGFCAETEKRKELSPRGKEGPAQGKTSVRPEELRRKKTAETHKVSAAGSFPYTA